MRAPLFPFHSARRTFALLACVLFLQGCSAVKLAYNQAPQLVYWRLNNYFNLTDAQADRLRSGCRPWPRRLPSPQDRRVGPGDRLTSVDGRVLGVTASFGCDRPSSPITPAAHFGTPLPLS